MNKIVPHDFYSDEPPDRIIGIEKECSIQPEGMLETSDYISKDARIAAGYRCLGNFMDNGFKGYVDLNFAEIATGEARGPHQAATVDAAVNVVLTDIVNASGLPHRGVFVNSGLVIDGNETSNGYHINYLIPRKIYRTKLFQQIIASSLASSMWTMSGMVGREGFEISQKVSGIGGPALSTNMDRRAYQGYKPMAMVPPISYEKDTVGGRGWARLEVRFADSGFSRRAKELGFAATSLALRLLEHPTAADTDSLYKFSFEHPATAAKLFSKDLTFKQTAPTLDGKNITWLDYQEQLVNAYSDLKKRIKLPDDEVSAIPYIAYIIDQLRQSDFSKNEYGKLPMILDFAARHMYLSSKFDSHDLHSANKDAVSASLSWDRILPSGGGIKYWSQFQPKGLTDDIVAHASRVPQVTRAAIRSRIIRQHVIGETDIAWNYAYINNVKHYMNDVYAN